MCSPASGRGGSCQGGYNDTEPHLLDKNRFDLTEDGVNAGRNILQFYSAPHIGDAITPETVTTLFLWCVDGDRVPQLSDTLQAARIPLGADPESGQYHLARNTFYSFNAKLTLKK